jgi:hypothetical protein
MNETRLPPSLAAGIELQAVNQALRDRATRIDWSAVQEAPDESLTVLLAGLDLSEGADLLGLETVPEQFQAAVVAALDGGRARRSDSTTQAAPPLSSNLPAVWTAPPEVEPELVELPEDEAEETDTSAEPRFLAAPSALAIREEFEELVFLDLHGPAGGPEEEVDEGSVRDRYLVGMLAPLRSAPTGEEEDDFVPAGDDSTEEGVVDPGVNSPRWMFPSSFGLSFTVDGAARALRVEAKWGRYERARSEKLVTDTGEPKLVWKRVPMGGVLPELPLAEGQVERWRPDLQQDVVVHGTIRRGDNDWIVTLFLVNEQAERKSSKDAAWMFQPELIVEDADRAAVFCHRPQLGDHQTGSSLPADEQERLSMLYRRRLEFAAGHGVSVHADVVDGQPDRARRVSTVVAPTYEVAQTSTPIDDDIPELSGLVLDMQALADLDPDKLSAALAPLTSAYAIWISAQRERIDAEPDLDAYRAAAARSLADCEQVLQRIRDGIKLLVADTQAAAAFRFMNRAMAMQRIRTTYTERKRRGADVSLKELDVPENRSWRPFQLAFILLNLPSLTLLDHPERGTQSDAGADLLWFPTGGGKTEAYLGLTAYTLAIRRLQGNVAGRAGEYGVAVLMRYTLRLLTLQQFQRATALICACELIRREALAGGDTCWGEEPFRIGLWVGHRMTPNSTDASAEAIKLEHGHFRRSALGSGSPAQLTNCPWCGESIDPGRHIKVESYSQGRSRTLTYCGDPLGRCPFSERKSPGEGLPIVVVDEEIYRLLPALLIATVDKFAQMPWNGATQMLFGQVTGRCERHGFRSPEIEDSDSHPRRQALPPAKTIYVPLLRPLDLIIQDELHLISGPLGTLVGLYETAIDELATWEVNGKRVRPKVVASTATIRRAEDQVRALFLRQVSIFPPNGLDIEDNFFALQRETGEEYPGRKYFGICAQGKRLKAVLIRVYVAHLAAAQALYEKYGPAADTYMTLVGYFSSMRELGGMRRLVDDDVRSRLRNIERRGLAKRNPPFVQELTSRRSSSEIPRVLDQLEIGFDPARERLPRSERGKSPIDVLLATNMVSVGVDVQRLGLMVVAGQPKTTAEYIQATSRVGRRKPGLVTVVFNWARPRDLSHYERFEHYHATFYRQVEALSVTPFAPRALDRALTALLVSLIRLRGAEFNENGRAGAITRDHPYVRAAIDAITARALEVDVRHEARDFVEAELLDRLDQWLHEAQSAESGRIVGYRDKKDGRTVGLLHQPSLEPWDEFTCLNSLRDVEPSIDLILDDGQLDDEPAYQRVATASERES